jgi:hypothetical protein
LTVNVKKIVRHRSSLQPVRSLRLKEVLHGFVE